MNDSTIVKIVAVVCLTVICSIALIKGIDSVLVGTVASIIGGIAGYEFGRRQKTTEESKEG